MHGSNALAPRRRPYLELRFEPGDERLKTRSVHLTRSQAVLGVLGLGLVALYLLASLVLAVPVGVSLLSRREYETLITQRAAQGGRLQSLVEALEEQGDRAEEARTRLRRILFAYRLPHGETADTPGRQVSTTIPATQSIYAGLIARGTAEAASSGRQLPWLGAALSATEVLEQQSPDRARMTPSILPLRGTRFILTSPFDPRRDPFTEEMALHSGLDIGAPAGTPILATADGTVVFASRYPLRPGIAWWRFGNLVAIRHGEGFVTLFGHCDELRVRDGQRVRRGEVIATVGDTGWSTDPHLHYEVRRRREDRLVPVDPRLHIFDYPWRDEEQILIHAERAAELEGFEPLPRTLQR